MAIPPRIVSVHSHVRQLAVGSAALNTLWQIGAFLSPYAWGVTKDATGSFRAALTAASVVVVVEALVILYVRARVMSERRERLAAVALLEIRRQTIATTGSTISDHI